MWQHCWGTSYIPLCLSVEKTIYAHFLKRYCDRCGNPNVCFTTVFIDKKLKQAKTALPISLKMGRVNTISFCITSITFSQELKKMRTKNKRQIRRAVETNCNSSVGMANKPRNLFITSNFLCNALTQEIRSDK